MVLRYHRYLHNDTWEKIGEILRPTHGQSADGMTMRSAML